MKGYTLAAFILIISFFMLSNSREQEPHRAEVPQIIVDVDIVGSTDDLFALQMLYRYADKGLCKLLGIVVDRTGDTNAAVVDVLNNYYGYHNLPIGMERHGAVNPGVYINYCLLAQLTNIDGTPMFPRTYSSYDSLPDGYVLYRQLLSSAPDHSVTFVVTGFVTSVARLLASGADQYSPLSGVELVRRKVKGIYFMGTKLTAETQKNADVGYNLGCDIASATTFFNMWPSDVDIILSPSQVGDAIEYDSSLVVSDISWIDIHPVKQTYLNVPCNTGQKMWDPMAAIQAVLGDSLFVMSQRGRVIVHPDEKKVDFIADINGNCRYQYAVREEWIIKILDLIRASN